MKRVSGLFLIVTMLVSLLPVTGVSAQAPVVNCQNVAAQLGATYEEGVLNSASYCVIYPPKRAWNRDLVVFAHGYVFADPLNPLKAPAIPWDQAIRGDLNLPAMLVNLGYGFAITSYHKDGLAVKEGVQDILSLVNLIKTTNHQVRRTFLTGVSEGGLVTALTIEKYPQLFSGGFATCGPIGDFQKQVNYWGNFRALFDVAYPPALRYPYLMNLPYPPSTPIYIDPAVTLGWGSETAPGPVGQVVGGFVLSDPAKDLSLVTTAGAAFDPSAPSTVQATIAGLLTYNVMATNEGRRELAGNPLLGEAILKNSNTGSPYYNNGAVNGVQVEQFTEDPAVVPEIAANYQTSGSLSRQLVVMHTTGDPIVPFWHALLYTQKVVKQGSLADYTLIPINRYGHCSFTPAEALLGFYIMVARSTLMPFTAAQVQQALPDQKAQEEFSRLKQEYAGKIK